MCVPCALQAAEFASDDHVDVKVRQRLATLLFDNAEMRKQLNAYTEGILLQTTERLDQKKEQEASIIGGLPTFGLDSAFASKKTPTGAANGVESKI